MRETVEIIDPQINFNVVFSCQLLGKTPSHAYVAIIVDNGAKDVPVRSGCSDLSCRHNIDCVGILSSKQAAIAAFLLGGDKISLLILLNTFLRNFV